jgi:PTS system mannose-specific IIC component
MATDLLASPTIIALLLLLGGWVAVDGTAFGQFMISRPLVAATLAGWICGNPLAGVEIGVVLEAFHLSVLPVGAARYPEGGPPAVVAGAVVAAEGAAPGALLTALVFALSWEWVAGATIRSMRSTNVRILGIHSPDTRSSLQARHLLAVALDFGRGVLLVGVGLGVVMAMLEVVRGGWPFAADTTRSYVGALLVGLLATASRIFGGRARLFAAGAALAGLIVVLR